MAAVEILIDMKIEMKKKWQCEKKGNEFETKTNISEMNFEIFMSASYYMDAVVRAWTGAIADGMRAVGCPLLRKLKCGTKVNEEEEKKKEIVQTVYNFLLR